MGQRDTKRYKLTPFAPILFKTVFCLFVCLFLRAGPSIVCFKELYVHGGFLEENLEIWAGD